jgi:hypothetical protein
MQYRRCVQGRMLLTELETSARTESKRMTNHNTPQLTRMGLPVHCATFPGLSRLNTRAVGEYGGPVPSNRTWLTVPLLRISRDVGCIGKRPYCGLSSAQLVVQRVFDMKNGHGWWSKWKLVNSVVILLSHEYTACIS